MKKMSQLREKASQAIHRPPTSMSDFLGDSEPSAPTAEPKVESEQGRADKPKKAAPKRAPAKKKATPKQETQSSVEKILVSAPPEDIALLKTLMESVNCNQSETVRLALRALDGMPLEKRRAMVFELPRVPTGRKPSK